MAQINKPDIFSRDGSIEICRKYHSNGFDYEIQKNDKLNLILHAKEIMIKEIKQKEINVEKIQKMLNSSDKELQLLAISTLKEKTKWAGIILEHLYFDYDLSILLLDYMWNEKLNLLI